MHLSKRERSTIWGLFGLAIAINIAGYVLNLYEQFWWFDGFLHFFTPLVLTLVLALRLYDNGLAEIREHKLVLALVVACIGVTSATLWEIAEWTYDQFVAANTILGKTDTIVDLILGTAGAIVARLHSI
jgi:hypothetical protein